MAAQLILQLAHPDLGHVELVLDLPEVRVADGVLAAVRAHQLARLIHRAAERQALAHALRVEGGDVGDERGSSLYYVRRTKQMLAGTPE